jgi:hypothetical protein
MLVPPSVPIPSVTATTSNRTLQRLGRSNLRV